MEFIDKAYKAVKGKAKKCFSAPIVNIIRLQGPIMASNNPKHLNLVGLEEQIEKAFTGGDRLKAVALQINCPGGSPVQSAMIGSMIRHAAEKADVPVYAFCEDVAASGGYWLACAADEIYANASAIIGSIGVIYAGFGFTELIKKYGVERRVITAGKRKALLDSFEDLKDEDVALLKEIQGELHENFIGWVKERRGDKLVEDEDMFSGLFWLAEKAKERGLIDGIADCNIFLEEKFGEDVKLNVIAKKEKMFSMPSLMGGAAKGDIAASLVDIAEEKSLWGRYGL